MLYCLYADAEYNKGKRVCHAEWGDNMKDCMIAGKWRPCVTACIFLAVVTVFIDFCGGYHTGLAWKWELAVYIASQIMVLMRYKEDRLELREMLVDQGLLAVVMLAYMLPRPIAVAKTANCDGYLVISRMLLILLFYLLGRAVAICGKRFWAGFLMSVSGFVLIYGLTHYIGESYETYLSGNTGTMDGLNWLERGMIKVVQYFCIPSAAVFYIGTAVLVIIYLRLIILLHRKTAIVLAGETEKKTMHII